MPAKIRLQRHGSKGRPFYHIVVADGRAPRDGKFIEKIGTYNPISKPAEIEIDFDKAVDWMQKGVQPTDTARAILSYKGVLYKNHLLNGVKKGALTLEDVEVKVAAWMADKQNKILQKIKDTDLEAKNQAKKMLEAERKISEKRALAIAEKRSSLAAEAARAAAASAGAVAEAPAEVAEAPAEVAEAPAEVTEAPAVVAEALAEVAEAPAEVAEAPAEVAEAPAEVAEAPAEEASETPSKE
jgi:small subunit ribosomal protein S16